MTRPPTGIVSSRPGGWLSPESVTLDEGMVDHVRASLAAGEVVKAEAKGGPSLSPDMPPRLGSTKT